MFDKAVVEKIYYAWNDYDWESLLFYKRWFYFLKHVFPP